MVNKIYSGDILAENCSNNSSAEGLAIARKMVELIEADFPGSEIRIIENTSGYNPNEITDEDGEELDDLYYERACELI